MFLIVLILELGLKFNNFIIVRVTDGDVMRTIMIVIPYYVSPTSELRYLEFSAQLLVLGGVMILEFIQT